jgi:hypothetical protein
LGLGLGGRSGCRGLLLAGGFCGSSFLTGRVRRGLICCGFRGRFQGCVVGCCLLCRGFLCRGLLSGGFRGRCSSRVRYPL